MRAEVIRRAAVVPLLTAVLVASMAPRLVRSQASSSRAAPSPAVARSLDARARTELLEAREQVWRAWFAHDSVQLERLLPRDGFLAVGADSVWRNRDQTIAESRAFTKSGGRLVSIEFPRTEMQVFGDVVVIYTTFRYTTEHGGQRHTSAGNAVEVFERRDGVWQNPSWYLDFLPKG
ncbi:MAG TPA: nuclear transport factor 2 family protein [Gemmatimonadaceae bacterium]|nr:nuclear transport factor 2 family protein [Gemmatimonadaceae bacterium]